MSRRSAVFVAFSVLALTMEPPFSSAPLAFSQDRLKTTAQLVLVDLIVTDEKGEFVRGLTPADFEVTEDGRPMAIKSLDLFDFGPSAADPSSPVEALPEARKPRLVVVFDSLNTIKRFLDNRKPLIIERLIELIGQGYDVTVFELTGSGGMRLLQPFTSNAELIRRAVDTAGGSIWVEHDKDHLSLPKEMLQGERNADGFNQTAARFMYDIFVRYRLQASTLAFLSVLNVIKDIPGRKPVLLVSGGFPSLNLSEVEMAKIFDPFSILNKERKRVFTAEEMFRNLKAFANSHQISFYTLYADSFLRYLLPDIALDNWPSAVNFAEIMRREIGNLGDLAAGTGGSAMLGGDQFKDFERMVRSDLSSYYELSYVPPRKSADGKYHRIKVKARRPGVRLRHRAGYYDYEDDQKTSLLFASAAFNPSLFQTVPFAARVIPVAVGPGRFVLWMTMALPVPFVLQDAEGRGNRFIQTELNVIDEENKPEMSARINIPIRLTPELQSRLAKARYFGFNARSGEMVFKKARHRAVIALYDEESRAVSAVECPLDFPDPSGPEGAVLQGVFGRAVEVPRDSPKDFFISAEDGTLEFPRYKFYPMSVNDFGPRDKVMLYLQVKEGRDETVLNLAFSTSRGDEAPRPLPGREIARSRNGKAGLWNAVFELDFSALDRGDYALSIAGPGGGDHPGRTLDKIPFRLF